MEKTDGFTIERNNFYHPPDEETREAPTLDPQGSAMTVTSTTNPNDYSIPYKYLSPHHYIANMRFRGLCLHHSTGYRLDFHKIVRTISKAIIETIDSYEKEFPLDVLANYSAKHKFKLINDFTHLYGSLYRIRLALKEGNVQLGNVDWENILQCEGKYLFRIVLMKKFSLQSYSSLVISRIGPNVGTSCSYIS